MDTVTAPQSTLKWGHTWDGSGEKCTDRCGTSAWAPMSAALGSFSAVCYLTGVDVCESSDGLPQLLFSCDLVLTDLVRSTDKGLGGRVPIGLVGGATYPHQSMIAPFAVGPMTLTEFTFS